MATDYNPGRKARLKEIDPEIFGLIQKETAREEFGLEMIPSENFVSEAVLEAMGSVLTNKYAEGQPGKRYYGGCEVVDQVEETAKARAQKLFGAEYANVQAHSGAAANQAVYEAVAAPGDTVMGMRLDMGGHLTHGSPVNFSGRYYRVVAYGVRETDHLIDEAEVRDLALKHRPKMIICGATAYSRHIDWAMFRRVADEVGAIVMADIAHYAGLIAAGLYPSPVPSCQIVTSTTHKTLRGPRSGFIMAKRDFAKALDKAVFPGLQGGPHMHIIAAKAVTFWEAMRPEFKVYSQNIIDNARALSSALIEQGFKIVSGGTDSHVMLVDMRPADITGKEAQAVLEKVGITSNKNTIPFDPQPPLVGSGIRIGSPALTSRGMGTAEMRVIAGFIKQAIEQRADEKKLASLREDVVALSRRFPLYGYRLEG
jgi:glycine hydroxymethyltransferase